MKIITVFAKVLILLIFFTCVITVYAVTRNQETMIVTPLNLQHSLYYVNKEQYENLSGEGLMEAASVLTKMSYLVNEGKMHDTCYRLKGIDKICRDQFLKKFNMRFNEWKFSWFKIFAYHAEKFYVHHNEDGSYTYILVKPIDEIKKNRTQS